MSKSTNTEIMKRTMKGSYVGKYVINYKRVGNILISIQNKKKRVDLNF